MAGSLGRVNIELGYSIDESAFSKIQQSFEKISATARQPGQQMNQEMQKVQGTVSTVEASLKSAFNTKLGTVDIQRFNQNLQLSGTNLNKIRAEMSSVGTMGANAFSTMNKQLLNANTTLQQTRSFVSTTFDTFLKAAQWSVAYRAFNSITTTVKNAYSYVVDLDTALNRIRIVTGDSAEKMEQFAQSANKAAKQLGSSTKAYAEAALIFYEQGLSDKEVEQRATITTKVSNVTDLDTEEASENLTAVWNGFKIKSEDAEATIDQLANVAAHSASNLGELSTAMSKVASAANTMGVSSEQLTAQIATIEEATRQAPESIGTALKTIYARMGDLKVGGTDEFGVQLGEVSGAMKKMGIDILDETGSMRDLGEVITETAEKWSGWSREQKEAAAVAMAGKRQYNNLFALFENWDRYNENLDYAENSLGTLQTQQDTYLESAEGKMGQLKATMEGFYGNLIDSDAIKSLIDGLKQIAGFVQNLSGTFMGITPILSGIVLLLNQRIGGALANLVTGSTKSIQNAQQEKLIQQEITNAYERREKLFKSGTHILGASKIEAQQAADASGEAQRAQFKQRLLNISKDLNVQEQEFINGEALAIQKEQERLVLKANEIGLLQGEGKWVEKTNSALKKAVTTENGIVEIDEKKLQAAFENASTAQRMTTILGNQLEKKVEELETAEQIKEIENQILSEKEKEKIKEDVIQEAKSKNKELTQEELEAEIKKRAEQNKEKEIIDIIRNSKQENKQMTEEEALEEAKRLTSLDNVAERVKLIEQYQHNGLILTKEQVEELKSEETTSKRVAEIFEQVRNEVAGTKNNFRALGQDINQNNARVKLLSNSLTQLEKRSLMKNAFSGFGRGLTSATMAISSFSSMIETINNPDISGWEKFTQVSMSLTMSFGMVASAVNGLKTGFLALRGATLLSNAASIQGLSIKQQEVIRTGILAGLTKKEMEAKLEDAGVTNYQTVAEKLYAGSVSATIGKIITQTGAIIANTTEKIANFLATNPLIAAGIALAAATTLLVMAIIKENSAREKHNEQLKKDNETLKEQTSLLKDTKDKYSELKSSIESLRDSTSALGDLTEGTKEWREAVFDLNSQVLELVEKYPILMDYMSKDENGVFSISSQGFDAALKELENSMELQQNNILNTQSKIYKDKSVLAIDNLNDTLKRDGVNAKVDFDGSIEGINISQLKEIYDNTNTKETFKQALLDSGLSTDLTNQIVSYYDIIVKYFEQANQFLEQSNSLAEEFISTKMESSNIGKYNALASEQKDIVNKAVRQSESSISSVQDDSFSDYISKWGLLQLVPGYGGVGVFDWTLSNILGNTDESIKIGGKELNLYENNDTDDDEAGVNKNTKFYAQNLKDALQEYYGEPLTKATTDLIDSFGNNFNALAIWAKENNKNYEDYDVKEESGKYVIVDKKGEQVEGGNLGDDYEVRQYIVEWLNKNVNITQMGEKFAEAAKELTVEQAQLLDKSGKYNFNQLTREQVNKLVDEEGNFKDSEKIEEAWDTVKFTDEDRKRIKEGVKEASSEYINMTNSIVSQTQAMGSDVKKIFQDMADTNKISNIDLQNTANIFSQASKNGNLEKLTSSYNKLTSEQKVQLSSIWSEIDWSSGISVKKVEEQLKNKYENIDFTKDFENGLKGIVKEIDRLNTAARTAEYSISAVADGMQAYQTYAQNIKKGDTLSKSDYDNLIKTITDDVAQEGVAGLFTQTVDGKYMYVGDDPQALQKLLTGGKDTVDVIEEANKNQELYERARGEGDWEGKTSSMEFAKGEGLGGPGREKEEGKTLGSEGLKDLLTHIYSESNKDNDTAFKDFFAGDTTVGYLVKQLQTLETYEGLSGKEKKEYENKHQEEIEAAQAYVYKNGDKSQGLSNIVEEILKDMQTKWSDFITRAESGDYDFSDKNQRSHYFSGATGLNELQGMAAEVSEQTGTKDYQDDEAYQNARVVILQNALDTLDSSIAAEEAYEEELKKQNITIGDLKKNSDDYNKSLQDIAQSQFLMKNAVTSLSKIWNNTYKDAKKGTKEWSEAIDESAKALTAAFGYNISSEFVSNHLGLIKKAANGSTKALRTLQKELSKEYVADIKIKVKDEKKTKKNILKGIEDIYNQIPNLEVGVSLGKNSVVSEFIKGTLNPLIEKGKITKAQIEDMLGMSFAIKYKKKNGKIIGIDVKKTTYTGTGGLNYSSDSEAGLKSSDRNGGSGGGSGSSKEKETLDKEDYDNDIYHRVNQQLELIEKTYDRLNDAQDQLWGSNAVANMKRINKNLDENISKLKKRVKIAQEDMKNQRGQLKADYGLKFDKKGVVKNYTETYSKLYKELETMRKKYNKMSASEQDAKAGKQLKKDYENQKEKLSNFKDEVSDYEDVYSQYVDDLATIDEKTRQKIENEMKTIDIEIEVDVNTGELERNWQDFLRKTQYANNDYTNIAKSQLEDWKSYSEEISNRQEKLDNLRKKLTKKEKKGKVITKSEKDELNKLIKDQESALENQANLATSLFGNLKSIFDEEIKQLDRIDKKYSNILSNITHSMDVTKLLMGEDSYAQMGIYYREKDITNQARVGSFQKTLNDLQKKRSSAEKRLRNAATEQEKKNAQDLLDSIEDQITTTTNNLQGAIKDTFSNLIDEYKNTINEIYQGVEDTLTGGLGFDAIQDGIKKTKAYNDDWLDDVQRIYETDKLIAAFDEAALKNNSLDIQNKILQVKKEELAILEKQDKLSQYDIDRANAKLNLLLKEIALQEARENKSKLRLRRDAQGNYSYQYTANQDSLNKAQQELRDAQNKVNELDQKRALELQDKIVSNAKSWLEERKKLEEQAYLGNKSQTEIDEAYARIDEYYSQNADELLEENKDVADNLVESSLETYNRLYGTHFKGFEDMTEEEKNNFNNFLYGANGLIPLTKNGFEKMSMDVKNSFKNAKTASTEALNGIKTSLQAFANDAGAQYKKILKGDKDTAGLEDVTSETEKLSNKTSEWLSQFGDSWGKINNTIKKLDSLQEKQAKYNYGNGIEQATKYAKALERLNRANNSSTGPKNNGSNKKTAKQYDRTIDTSGDGGSGDGGDSSTVPSGVDIIDDGDDDNDGKNDGKKGKKDNGKKKVKKTNKKDASNINDPTDTGKGSGKKKSKKKIGKRLTKSPKSPKLPKNPKKAKEIKDKAKKEAAKKAKQIKDIKNVINIKDKNRTVYWTADDHSEIDIYGKPYGYGWIGKYHLTNKKENGAIIGNSAKIVGIYNGNYPQIRFSYWSEKRRGGYKKGIVTGYPKSIKTFTDRYTGYDTGGYTGAWNSKEGKLALLHEKELVLNKKDTENILQAISQLREMKNTLALDTDGILKSMVKELALNVKDISNNNNQTDLNQKISITANFPNATNRNEIEAAFASLEARATQYAWSKDLKA